MEQTFEQKINELEGILKAFENKDLELDRSLELYEKGIRLIRECTKALEDAQKKVEEINVDYVSGDVKLELTDGKNVSIKETSKKEPER